MNFDHTKIKELKSDSLENLLPETGIDEKIRFDFVEKHRLTLANLVKIKMKKDKTVQISFRVDTIYSLSKSLKEIVGNTIQLDKSVLDELLRVESLSYIPTTKQSILKIKGKII